MWNDKSSVIFYMLSLYDNNRANNLSFDNIVIVDTIYNYESIIHNNFNLVKKKNIIKLPKLIVLDFSYEGNDIYSSQNIYKCINRFNEEYNVNTIAISQNPIAVDNEKIFYYNFAWELFKNKNTQEKNTLKYKFNYLGGYPRKDKILFFNKLVESPYLKESIYSFGTIQPHNKSLATIKTLEDNPAIIDHDMLYSKHENKFWNSIFWSPYITSRFSLVQETEMQNESRRYTEKTIKAIATKTPFVIAGNYKVIEQLKKDGFLTFEPYINQSYDSEPDQNKRSEMIIEEANRLSRMSDNEWEDFYNTFLIDIIKYNFDRLQKLPSKEKFISSLKF